MNFEAFVKTCSKHFSQSLTRNFELEPLKAMHISFLMWTFSTLKLHSLDWDVSLYFWKLHITTNCLSIPTKWVDHNVKIKSTREISLGLASSRVSFSDPQVSSCEHRNCLVKIFWLNIHLNERKHWNDDAITNQKGKWKLDFVHVMGSMMATRNDIN